MIKEDKEILNKRYKILTGFPCNNGAAYCIMVDGLNPLLTKDQSEFDKAMKEGFIEIKEEVK